MSPPYNQPIAGSDVNPRNEWRFRCPENHSAIKWTGATGVHCTRCTKNADSTEERAAPRESEAFYPVSRIVDKKTGLSLAELMDRHADQQRGSA